MASRASYWSLTLDWIERLRCGPGRVALGLGTAELLQWAYQPHLADNRPHRHTFFEVCQVGRWGAGRFLAGGRDHELQPGAVFIARPGVVHQIVNTTAPGMELFWVSFQWTPGVGRADGDVDRLLRGFAEGPVVCAPDEGGRLAAHWPVLRAVIAGGALPGADVQINALVGSLLLTVAQIGAGAQQDLFVAPNDTEPGDATARLAVRYIHDNLYRPLSVGEIAGQVYTSRRHLSRLFLQFTGTSPAAYIIHARMDRAKGLLVRTSTPIKEIAEAVGMPDVHHFTRVFAQQVGCPPGEYRRGTSARPVPIIQNHGALV